VGIKSELNSLKTAIEAAKSHAQEPVKCEMLLVAAGKIVDRLIGDYETKKKAWQQELAKLNQELENANKAALAKLENVNNVKAKPMEAALIVDALTDSGVPVADVKKFQSKIVANLQKVVAAQKQILLNDVNTHVKYAMVGLRMAPSVRSKLFAD
jgi:hypothetical protein